MFVFRFKNTADLIVSLLRISAFCNVIQCCFVDVYQITLRHIPGYKNFLYSNVYSFGVYCNNNKTAIIIIIIISFVRT